MNAKVIEAMKGIRDNLSIIIEEIEGESHPEIADAKAEEVTAEVKAVEEVADNTPAKTRKEREANEKLPNPNSELTQEQLDGLSYNNLKRLAKEMGITAVGSREDLTQKILNFDGEVEESTEETEEVETPAPEKSKTPTKPAEEVEEDDEEDEEEVDPIVAKVNEAVEEMTNEDIMDILADVGVKAKGKRQSLISAVIQAVKDGKIDLDDDEDDEDAEEVEDATDSEEEVADTNDESEYGINDLNNPDMTDERKSAIKAYESEIRADFKNGDINRKQLVEWLNEFHNTKDTMKKKSDEEILDEYIHCSCLLINDEGEMPEDEGAYTVNGIPYCCGHELAYDEDNNTYICETCGSEYEAGEDE